ncbi:hypothetical protein ABZ383_35975 [Streptomyces sp. NPDC005900]|uniref:hypothetical protein n=1 Tax=Streptomyces sp. NPDC005900 TaxID=3154569 RepID=UPI0033E97787
MVDRQYSASSVRQLAARVERIAPRDPARWEGRETVPGAAGLPVQVSAERGRQLWMVVGMFDRAVGRQEMPGRAARTVDQLFTWAALRPFWELAVAGELRAFATRVGRPLPLASQRVVLDCLRMLAEVVVPDKRVRLPVLDQAELKPTVAPGQLTAVYRELVELAERGPLSANGTSIHPDERTRLLAMVAVVLDAAPRSGELAAMRLSDVGPGEEWVAVTRRPQNQARRGVRQADVAAELGVAPSTVAYALSENPALRRKVSEQLRQDVLAVVARAEQGPRVERYALREGTRVALRRWLRRRAELVEPVEGGKSALWVTVRATKVGPPGVSILPQGLGQSFMRGMSALNVVMAGAHGWEPMPTRLEQLRRAVDVAPLTE